MRARVYKVEDSATGGLYLCLDAVEAAVLSEMQVIFNRGRREQQNYDCFFSVARFHLPQLEVVQKLRCSFAPLA